MSITRPLTPAASVVRLPRLMPPTPAAVLLPSVTVPALTPRSANRFDPFSTRLPLPVLVIEPGPKIVFASVKTPGPESTIPAPAVEMPLLMTRPDTPAASVVRLPRLMPPIPAAVLVPSVTVPLLTPRSVNRLLPFRIRLPLPILVIEPGPKIVFASVKVPVFDPIVPAPAVEMPLVMTRPSTPAASVAPLPMLIPPTPAAVLVPSVTRPALMPRSVNRLLPLSSRLPLPVLVIEPGPKIVFASVKVNAPLSMIPAPAVEMPLLITRRSIPAASVVPLARLIPPMPPAVLVPSVTVPALTPRSWKLLEPLRTRLPLPVLVIEPGPEIRREMVNTPLPESMMPAPAVETRLSITRPLTPAASVVRLPRLMPPTPAAVLLPSVTVPALTPRSANRFDPFSTRLPLPVLVIEPGPKIVFASVKTPGPESTIPAPAVEMPLLMTRPDTPAASVVRLPRLMPPIPAAVLVPSVTRPALMPRSLKPLAPFSTRLPPPCLVIEPGPVIGALIVAVVPVAAKRNAGPLVTSPLPVEPLSTYPSVANCRPWKLCSPAMLTVPGVVMNTPMPPCQLALSALGGAPVQLVLSVFHVPDPPLITPLPTPSAPSQYWTSVPGAVTIRLTCPGTSVCTMPALPAGSVFTVRPLSVSAPPYWKTSKMPGPKLPPGDCVTLSRPSRVRLPVTIVRSLSGPPTVLAAPNSDIDVRRRVEDQRADGQCPRRIARRQVAAIGDVDAAGDAAGARQRRAAGDGDGGIGQAAGDVERARRDGCRAGVGTGPCEAERSSPEFGDATGPEQGVRQGETERLTVDRRRAGERHCVADDEAIDPGS